MTNTRIPNTPRAQAALSDLIAALRSAEEAPCTDACCVWGVHEAVMGPARRLLDHIEVARQTAVLNGVLEDEVTRAECHNCDLDIEDVDASDDWLDRGGNRRCPSGELHVPH